MSTDINISTLHNDSNEGSCSRNKTPLMRGSGTWRGLLTNIYLLLIKNQFEIFYPQCKTFYFPGFERMEFKVKSCYVITYPKRRIIVWSIWCLWISFTWFTISVKNYSDFIESLGLWSLNWQSSCPCANSDEHFQLILYLSFRWTKWITFFLWVFYTF